MRNQEAAVTETADVLIVGGGVIGLSIARALATRGAGRVTLIERASPGAEASTAAAGMLAAQAEADQADDFLQLASASRELYPPLAEALREETGIDIELERTGTIYLALTDEDALEIERRFRWQSEAGLPVERLSGDEARRLEPFVSPQARAALRFPLDVQVENRRLIAALAASAAYRRVRLLTGTNVYSLLIEHGRVCGVETSQGIIHARAVVIASGAWSSFLAVTDSRVPPVRIEPVRGQMLCLMDVTRPARHVLYSPRGYLVPRVDGRVLAGSTTEHAGFDKHVTVAGLHAIAAHALEIAPATAQLPIADAWAGLRPRAADDWPVLGACAGASGLFYATGHYRNGILLAPITGELIAEEIMTGAPAQMLKSFSPERFKPSSSVRKFSQGS